MAAEGTCDWIGKSGSPYTYSVYSLPVSFNKDQDGNYIFVKIINNSWHPIYIGEGDLGDRISPNHHKWDCIKRNGATHVHVHLNANEKSRLDEEQDLLNNYATNCNG